LGEGGEGRRDGEDSLRQVAVAEQEDGGGGSASAARGLGEWDISGSGGASGTAADVGGGAGGGMWGHGSNGPLGFAGAQCKVLQRLGRSVFVVHQVAPGGRTDFVSAQHPGVSLAAGVGVFSRALRGGASLLMGQGALFAGDSGRPYTPVTASNLCMLAGAPPRAHPPAGRVCLGPHSECYAPVGATTGRAECSRAPGFGAPRAHALARISARAEPHTTRLTCAAALACTPPPFCKIRSVLRAVPLCGCP